MTKGYRDGYELQMKPPEFPISRLETAADTVSGIVDGGVDRFRGTEMFFLEVLPRCLGAGGLAICVDKDLLITLSTLG
jgi:hypothetical protein